MKTTRWPPGSTELAATFVRGPTHRRREVGPIAELPPVRRRSLQTTRLRSPSMANTAVLEDEYELLPTATLDAKRGASRNRSQERDHKLSPYAESMDAWFLPPLFPPREIVGSPRGSRLRP